MITRRHILNAVGFLAIAIVGCFAVNGFFWLVSYENPLGHWLWSMSCRAK